MRQTAGGDDDLVRVGRQHRRGIGIGVEVKGHPLLFALGHAPGDDRGHLAPAFVQRGQADLAAGLVCGLEHGDLVAAGGGDAGGLHPGGTGADDGDAFGRRRGRDVMGHRLLAPRRGVVQTERHAALIDPVEAVVRADAGADVVFAPGDDLAHQMRVGHVRPRHADHVELAGRDGVAGGGDIGDLGRVKGRKPCRRADFASEIQMGGVLHPLDRDHIGQAGVGVDMAAHDVQEIDQPAEAQLARHLDPLGRGHAARRHLVAGIAQPDDEAVATAGADRAQHVKGEPQPVVETAAIGRLEVVGQR